MEQATKVLTLPVSSAHYRLAAVQTSDTRSVLHSALAAALDTGDKFSSRSAWLTLIRLTADNDSVANLLVEKHWSHLSEPSTVLYDCQHEGVPISSIIFQKIDERAASIDARSLYNVRTPRTETPALWSQWLHTVLTERLWVNNHGIISGNQLVEADLPLPPEPVIPIPQNWYAQYLWLKFEHQPSHTTLADLIDEYARIGEVDSTGPVQWLQSWPLRAIRHGGTGPEYLRDVAAKLRKGLLGDIKLWRESQATWQSIKLIDLFGPNWDMVPWDPKRITRVPPMFLLPIWRLTHDDDLDAVDAYGKITAQFVATTNARVKAWLATQALLFVRMMNGSYKVKLDELIHYLNEAPQYLAMLLPKPKSVQAKDWHYLVEHCGGNLDNNWLLPPEFVLHGYTRKNISLPLLSAAARAITEETHGLGVLESYRRSFVTLLDNVTVKGELQSLYVSLLKLYAGILDQAYDSQLIELLNIYVSREPWLPSAVVNAIQKARLPHDRAERLLKALLPIVNDDQSLAGICVGMLQSIAGAKKSNIESPSVWSRLGFGHPMPHLQSATIKNTIARTQPIHLKEIELTNIGRIESLKLNFPEPKPEKGQWVVILGQNGAGKSTILRSIAIGLRDVKEPSIWPSRSFTREWARVDNNGEINEGKIKIMTEALNVTTYVTAATPAVLYQKPELIDAVPIPIFAYGCRRGSATGGASREVDLADGMEIATLMDDAASLIHAETWLKDLDGDALKTEVGEARYKSVCLALCELLDLNSIWVENRRVWVKFTSGPSIPFSELSDGYLTSAGWFIDLLARWTNMQESKGLVFDENFMSHMTGLVLIDELDLHLHPKWQIEIIGKTRKLLPKMSFVVTTHNPLTLVGAEANEIWHLETDGNELSAKQGIEPPLLLTGGQLYRRYFGIHDVYPSEIGRSMQRLSFLSGLPTLTIEENAELIHHRKVVISAGIPVETGDVGDIDASA